MDALARAGRYRAQGLHWVFRTDIADFFDSVEHDLLRAMVSTQVTDPAVVKLVDAWVQAPALTPDGLRTRTRGLPEGAPLSPVLANLYLRRFDDQVDGRHGRLVRYADDLALFCRDLTTAAAGAEHIADELALLRLRLNPDKTYIATFEAGFQMLGWVFQGEQGWPEQQRRGWTHPLAARLPVSECGGR
ncbi:MAG: reverse transcriptase domain-containing protein [Pseudonocardiaceae bacterium]